MTTKRHTQENLEALFQPDGSIAEKLKKLEDFREDAEISQWVDAMLLERIARQHQALQQAEANTQEGQAVLDKLAAPPWYPACFSPRCPYREGRRPPAGVGQKRQG